MDDPVVPDRIMYGVDIQDRIDLVQRPILPFFDLGHKLVCHVGDEAFRGLKTINIHQGIEDLPGGHSFGIHRDDLLVDPGDILLAFFDDLGLEGGVSVLRDVDGRRTVTGIHLFLFGAVTVIVLF